jgi:sugar phosphate permease
VSTALDADTVTAARRWSMLGATVGAQASSSVAINGPAFLIPALIHERGLDLVQAGTVAAMTMAGVMVSLIVWGLIVDRVGERAVLLAGLGGTVLAGVAATFAHGAVALGALLFAVGVFAASSSSASGRIVVGWFPHHRRGLAMGIRQMAQPLGVALAAATMAVTASHEGIAAALWIPVAASALALVSTWALVRDPARPEATAALTANPYRQDHFLLRIHAVSVLTVIPQFLVWTYSLAWLVQERHWSAGAAGVLVAVTHVVGAFGRIGAGALSDAVASRVRPLRWVALAAGVTMLLLGVTETLGIAVVLMVLASTVTVADNGLAFTSVAERAGAFWSGRALGAQNTAQYLAAAAVAPVAGLTITSWGYAATFGVAAAFPLVAVPLVPRHDAEAGGIEGA